jgi:hypothetical protein
MNIARNVIIVNTVTNINIVITVKINRIRNSSVNTNTIMYSHNACLLHIHIQMRTNSIEMYDGRRQRDCTILPYLHSKHFPYYKLNRTRYDSPL